MKTYFIEVNTTSIPFILLDDISLSSLQEALAWAHTLYPPEEIRAYPHYLLENSTQPLNFGDSQ